MRSAFVVSCFSLGIFAPTACSHNPLKTNSQIKERNMGRVLDWKEIAKFEKESRFISKDEVLKDSSDRIDDSFMIADNMRQRVGFWFDIYTLYDSKKYVFHHSDYPWIVFHVINLAPFEDGPAHKWTKYHKAQNFKKSEFLRIQRNLQNLAKKSHAKLNDEEKHLVSLVSQIPGNLRKNLKNASFAMRSQLGQKDFYLSGLKNYNAYRAEMEAIFARHKLPGELTRLPLVESSFNVNARSKVGASGIWQIMPGIGKKFLSINDYIDERNSPLKATKASAKILKENKMILKHWSHAVTAYNHGPNGLRKGSRVAGSTDIGKIIEKYNGDSFGFASKNFFASFLAALHAEKYQTEIFGQVDVLPHQDTEELKLKRSVELHKLASVTNMELEDLLRLNPDIGISATNKKFKLPKNFVLIVPRGTQEKAASNAISSKNFSALLENSNRT